VISIRIGDHEYGSWDEVPQEEQDQLIAAGVDPGPDGRIDTLDLWRAGGPVVQHTEVTGPGGRPLPPAIGNALASLVDAFGPLPPVPTVPATAQPPQTSYAGDPAATLAATPAATPRRIPLLVWGVVIAAAVLLTATLAVIVGG